MSDDSVSGPGWHVSRAGKSYGPISDKEFRSLTESGKVRPDDLVWRPGFQEWVPARSVLGQGPPPLPIQKETPRRRFGWKLGLGAAIVTAAIVALYLLSPYYTVWRLKHAIANKDRLALESIVDWPRIREQARSELMFAALAETLPGKDGFGVLGAALGSAMVNQLIDSFISPAAFIRASSDNPGFAEKMKSLDVWNGYFLGPTTFRLDIQGAPDNEDTAKLGVILGFQGTGWRVNHLDFPWNKLQEAQKAAFDPYSKNSPAEILASARSVADKWAKEQKSGQGRSSTTVEEARKLRGALYVMQSPDNIKSSPSDKAAAAAIREELIKLEDQQEKLDAASQAPVKPTQNLGTSAP